MPKSEHARAVNSEIQRRMGQADDGGTVMWAFIDAYGALLDGLTPVPIAGPLATLAGTIKSGHDGSGADALFDNPYFIGNGHGEDDPSEYTKKYMKNRLKKSLAAGGAS